MNAYPRTLLDELRDAPPSLPPHQRHSRTSLEAAVKVSSKAGTQLHQCLRDYADNGPSTDDEQQVRTGLPGDSQRARKKTIREEGWAIPTGETRKTRRNCDADVWVITQAGRQALAAMEETG